MSFSEYMTGADWPVVMWSSSVQLNVFSSKDIEVCYVLGTVLI